MARVMDGDVLGEDETVWTVRDAISGDEEEFESEPTKADVIAFKWLFHREGQEEHS